MHMPHIKARRQLECFLSALFLSSELIELRFIESWGSFGKKRSRVVRPAEWLRPHEFVSRQHELNSFAKQTQANIYFGVCPRPREGDSHDETIETIRCLWCDVDIVTPEEADERWNHAGVPRPSIVVSSGSGIHGYWLLQRDLKTPKDRSQFSAMLPYFYWSFGGDHVQNLSRVLRPPGTMNYKDARNGRRPLRCDLRECEPNRRYPLEAFSPWLDQAQQALLRSSISDPPCHATGPVANEAVSKQSDVMEVVSQLQKPSRDRSRRDFAIVCDLLRLGLTKEDIWPLVSRSSKFKSNGRTYFDLTVANAERSVLRDGPYGGPNQASM
jgi:hypothetical protein